MTGTPMERKSVCPVVLLLAGGEALPAGNVRDDAPRSRYGDGRVVVLDPEAADTTGTAEGIGDTWSTARGRLVCSEGLGTCRDRSAGVPGHPIKHGSPLVETVD
jgi:hypothetical protein